MLVKELLPETMAHPEAALILVNHMGSTALADSGRDAQHLADHFGMPAFAVDRPGSGHVGRSRTLREQLAADYAGAFEPLGEELHSRLEAAKIKKVTLLARSAGTLGAFVLAATDKLPVCSMYCADGVAWKQRSVAQGKHDYQELMELQEALLKGDEGVNEFVHPHGPQIGQVDRLKRLLSIPRCHYAEWNSYDVWASDTGLRLLMRLTGNAANPTQTRPAIWLDIPQVGLTDEHDLFHLQTAAPNAHIQRVDVPRTVHASFDNREFFARCAKPAISHLLGA